MVRLPGDRGGLPAVKDLVSVTIDYETWIPLPEGKRIDWEADVLSPAERLMRLFEGEGAPLTFMAEMGEYFWLRENAPSLALRMERQWADALRRGHDVQLHLHPNWLPELGAAQVGGRWKWDMSLARCEEYPGDLSALVARCKAALEEPLRRDNPGYAVTAFRAGTYQVQPFRRLYEALTGNGIRVDTSVFAGGCSRDRGYDFRLARSRHQPYFANRFDPQLLAPPGERGLVEIPVFTFLPGERWFLDGNEGPRIADRLLRYLRFRLAGQGNRSFVMIGHTKASHDFERIGEGLRKLARTGRFAFVTLSEMGRRAWEELSAAEVSRAAEGKAPGTARAVARLFPRPARPAVERTRLFTLLPLDRNQVVALLAPASRWGSILTGERPWMRISPVDGTERRGSDGEGSADAAVADGTLTRVGDVPRTLREIFRTLQTGGVFVASLPYRVTPPAGSPGCASQWDTTPHEARMRLEAEGFRDVDAFLGEEIVATADDLLAGPHTGTFLVRAWKRDAPTTREERAREAMDWVYRNLSPERSHEGSDAERILAGGHAFCMGYAIVLGEILRREGYPVRWVTMVAKEHPRGRGPERIETHEALAVTIDGREATMDPMANTIIPYAVSDIIRRPELAVAKEAPNDQYVARGYHLYDTAFWYSRVVRYAVRSRIEEKHRFVDVR